jgi:hypothetical protein
MALDTISDDFLEDTVLVYTSASAVDEDGFPYSTETAGVSVVAACVQSLGAEQRRDLPADYGDASYAVLTAVDPGVNAVNVRLDWTADAGGAITPPLQLRSLGAALRPGSRGRWTVYCRTLS